ncbi:MAG: VTT domain-containing protein [Oscillospiraceae bacterium]
MEQAAILGFLDRYGLVVVFVLVMLEYMNFPCLPAAVVFPAVGIWTRYTNAPFSLSLLTSLAAGLVGSAVIYFIGYTGGRKLFDKLCARHKKLNDFFEKYSEKIRRDQMGTLFIARLLPAVRTLIGFPAGVIRMDFGKYMLASALGIAITNSFYLIAGMGIGATLVP